MWRYPSGMVRIIRNEIYARHGYVFNSADLKEYFSKQAKELLDKGVTINKVNGKDTMLSISPADGSYKVNFGKEEFEAYFKNFLRPQLVDMLF